MAVFSSSCVVAALLDVARLPPLLLEFPPLRLELPGARGVLLLLSQAKNALCWPKICKLAHAFLWEYSYKGLKVGPTPGPTGRLSHCSPKSTLNRISLTFLYQTLGTFEILKDSIAYYYYRDLHRN